MKVLKKREKDIEVARQRQEQIDEGVKLAQKVDKLRETLSSLEEQERGFIKGMKDKIEKETLKLQEEIEILREEKESLLNEIASLPIKLERIDTDIIS